VTIAAHENGSGFPILWIHGFPLSAEVFEPQTRIEGYRHIRPDLPGFGATPASSASSMADYARELIALLDEKQIDRCVVAGVSMGGYIAMQLLRDIPQRIAAVILLDTKETPDTDESRALRRRQIDEVQSSGSTKSLVDAMLPKMIHQDEYRDQVRRIMASASPDGAIGALQAMASRPDSTGTLRNTKVPAFVICGDRDEITTMRDAERMIALLPMAELAPIARAAHLANYESSEQVNNLIAAFLGRALHHKQLH
jgi:3-oxoadipate enol-lactonase